MAQLLQLKSRQKSVESTLKITKAMKLIAAARLSGAKDRYKRSKSLLKKFRDFTLHLKDSEIAKNHPLCQTKEGKKELYVLLTTDKGFCGGYNLKLFHQVYSTKEEVDARGHEMVLVPIGTKGVEFFHKEDFIMPLSDEIASVWENELYVESRLLFQELEDFYMTGEYESIYIIYNEFQSVLTQEPIISKILPIEMEPEAGTAPIEFLYDPDEKAIVNRILPMHATLSIFKGMVEMKAGEYGSRMTAMDGANRNGEKLIRRLKGEIQRARQEAITTELSELIAGVVSLKGDI